MVYKLNKKDGTEFDNAIDRAFSEMEFKDLPIDKANQLFRDGVLGLYIAEMALKNGKHIYVHSDLFTIAVNIREVCELVAK